MNHLTESDSTPITGNCQAFTVANHQLRRSTVLHRELQLVLEIIMDQEFRRGLQRTKHHTTPGYLVERLWRAYMLSFILNMDCTNDLIRRLEENPNLVEICGFDMDRPLPSRWTFDRFIASLAGHQQLIERLLDKVVDQLHQRLPDFGVTIAIDSTPVRSHSSPDKKIKSDPEAGFMVKEGVVHKVWQWGYKMQLLVDTTWDLPVACEVALAKESDVASLIPLVHKARQKFAWFKPWHIVADSGYDAGYNYKAIYDIGSIPIIKMRKLPEGQDNRYSLDEAGIPHCHAGLPLLLIQHDAKKGMKYVCPHRAGRTKCPLSKDCTLRVAWVSRFWEYRKLCSVTRDSDEWNKIYCKRSAAERVFSKLKEHRRLNSHCHRGLAKVGLHCTMSVLSLAATALAEANANRTARVKACTRKVA